MRKKLLFLTLAALTAIAVLTAACGDDDDDDDGGGDATATATAAAATSTSGGGDVEPLEVTITAAEFEFDTPTIEAAPGQEVNVTLVNEDSAAHSITIGDTDVAQAGGGAEADGSFTASDDTTEFHCKFHSQMTGTITVSEDAASAQDDGGGGSVSGYGY